MNEKLVYITLSCVVALAVGILVYINTNNDYYFKFAKDSVSVYTTESFSVGRNNFVTNIDDISAIELCSSDENIFYIENGIVYPVSAGEANLNCVLSFKNKQYHTSLNVQIIFDDVDTIFCESLTLNMSNTLYMMTKSQSNISFEILPQNANYSISSSNTKVVSIEENGILKAKAFGRAKIEVSSKKTFDRNKQEYSYITKTFEVVVYDIENTNIKVLDLDYNVCSNLRFDSSDTTNGYILFDQFYVDIEDVNLTNTFDTSKILFYDLVEYQNLVLLPFKVKDVNNLTGSFCVTFLSTGTMFTTNQLSFYAYEDIDKIPNKIELEIVNQTSNFVSLNVLVYDINDNLINDIFAFKVDFCYEGVTSPMFDFVTEVSKVFNNIEVNFVEGYSFTINIYLSYNPLICASFVIE